MKIVVIGAGHGGLQAAKSLAMGGAEVVVFEKETRATVSYDWCDDAETKVFADLTIKLPEGQYRRSGCAALIGPNSGKPLRMDMPEEKCDWSLERRPLVLALADAAAEAGAEIRFGAPVESLLLENRKVRGVIAGGKSIRADLVIDSSGVFSPFRASLPANYKIQAQPAPEEVFAVYRAFFEPAAGVAPTEPKHKDIYLKHLGEMGISWCAYEPEGEVNVLVGRIGELQPAVLANALRELRRVHPIIGEKVLRGGDICSIPIRYCLSRMVGEGYAAIGDAAFMTIPMIGSGIANSLRAGEMLAQAILADKSVAVETLWKYQVRYFTEIGAGHLPVDILKRMLLASETEDVKFVFEGGIIGKKEMDAVTSGDKLVMTPVDILQKVIIGRHHLKLLLAFKSAVALGQKAEALALAIPREFDEAAVSAWQVQLDALFR